MKRYAAMLLFLMLFTGKCQAEQVFTPDLSALYEFAEDYQADIFIRDVYEDALKGDLPKMEALIKHLKTQLIQPLRAVFAKGAGMFGPAMLLVLMRSIMPQEDGGGSGACFLLKIVLLMGFSELAIIALDAAQSCMQLAKRFTDVVAPIITALLTAMGMNQSAALVSPSAALAGGMAENLFMGFGIPICRAALCTALVGNLSEAINLSRITKMLKKTANWGAGLAITLFTALIALQGNVSEALDGVGVRTAKFAVDSAAPVIGSGVSDVWESYISGVIITKNALGVSGIALLATAGLKPLISCFSAMFFLNVISALLGIFGEKTTADSAQQIAGICQMCLALATASLTVATVLLGAAMMAGQNLIA